jgi:hypothetical protein
MFKEIYRLLDKDGFVDVETPNISVIAQRIVDTGEITDNTIFNLVGEYYRPWDKDKYDNWENIPGMIHRNPWNFNRLKNTVEKIGFRIEFQDWKKSLYNCEENLYVKLFKN